MSQRQGIVGEILQTHKAQEMSRAATIQRQRQATGTPREFFRTPYETSNHMATFIGWSSEESSDSFAPRVFRLRFC